MTLSKTKKIYPKKSLGQNYLIDKNISKNIAALFNIHEKDNLLEIGPGEGALTKHLIQKTGNLTVVEIDSNNCKILNEYFAELKIINKDFLKINLNDFYSGSKLRIIGNIPYNITTDIIFNLIDNRAIIKDALLMLQEEVAVRLAAKPGGKEYGIPSVLLQAFSKPELLFKVSRNSFYPKPKVDSRLIHIDFSQSREFRIADLKFFRKLVKAAFSTRRKTLHNSLKTIGVNTNNLTTLGDNPNNGVGVLIDFDFTRRAETLSVDEFIYLSNIIVPLLKGG